MEHSCHIMLFPFQWKINDLKKMDFSNQISLKLISPRPGSKWKRASIQEGEERKLLFNEQNYFYEFTHDALYDFGDDNDESLIHHYERTETDEKEVSFVFGHRGTEYKLRLKYLNLNIYATGVGVLSFYLSNTTYSKPEDILIINQFARRVYPLFMEDLDYRRLLPDFVRIDGLDGEYAEDFEGYKMCADNRPASYVTKLIFDIAPNIDIIPVVDDRMFVLSWYKNNDITRIFSASEDIAPLKDSDFWYKYVFVQDSHVNCYNKAMRHKLIEDPPICDGRAWAQFTASRATRLFISPMKAHPNTYFPISRRNMCAWQKWCWFNGLLSCVFRRKYRFLAATKWKMRNSQNMSILSERLLSVLSTRCTSVR